MKLPRRVRKLVEYLTHTRIYRVLPRGNDVGYDIARWLPKCQINVVFDVGANVGDSTENYLRWFPKSHVYCFEPVRGTFQELKDNFQNNTHVECFQLALGSSKRKGQMVLSGGSDRFFLTNESNDSPTPHSVQTEEVDIVTINEFCEQQKIPRIHYMKIDTEGADLDVLKGAERMLNEQRIDIVKVEAGMNPTNHLHVPFEVLKNYLESKHYFLFGIYEQKHEWPTKHPHLRRTNPIFISQQVIENNRGEFAPSGN